MFDAVMGVMVELVTKNGDLWPIQAIPVRHLKALKSPREKPLL
jgi:hypothetical protein